MEIIYTKDNPKVLQAEAINEFIRSSSDKKVILLLSGGSQVDILDYLDWDRINKSGVTISLLDERFTLDDKISNSAYIKSIIRTKFKGMKDSFIPLMPRVRESREEYQNRINGIFTNWSNEIFSQSSVCIAGVGMGLDGHTAGIFPLDKVHESDTQRYKEVMLENIEERNFMCFEILEDNYCTTRGSVTFSFLRKYTTKITSYFDNQEKKEVFNKIHNKTKIELDKYPVQIWKEVNQCVIYIGL